MQELFKTLSLQSMNWKGSAEIESYLIESNFHLVIGKVLQCQAGF